MGDRVKHPADRAKLLEQFGVALTQPHQLQTVARDVANAHHGAAGDRAAVDLEMTAARTGERKRKTLAAIAQPFDGVVHLLREVRRKP